MGEDGPQGPAGPSGKSTSVTEVTEAVLSAITASVSLLTTKAQSNQSPEDVELRQWVEDLFSQADQGIPGTRDAVAHDGKVSFAELVYNVPEVTDCEQDRLFFNACDVDQDGYITPDELFLFLKSRRMT
jgi:hypothetical protein